jgi:hypothetical protein
MEHPVKLYISIILFWFIARGSICVDRNHYDNCGNSRVDTTLLQVDIPNQQAVNHVLDTINIYSKISDNIQTVAGETFTYPFNSMNMYLQTYKVTPSGSAYVLNYANINFNYFVNTGIFQNTGSLGLNVLFQRNEPFNTADVSFVAGDTGLYLITSTFSTGYYNEGGIQFYRANDYCNRYTGIPVIPETKQNKQYWDSLGITTLTLANSSNAVVASKADKNYLFVKVNP